MCLTVTVLCNLSLERIWNVTRLPGNPPIARESPLLDTPPSPPGGEPATNRNYRF